MAAQKITKQSLSDLEYLVLGITWRDGPCTAYRIRKEFVDSPNSHWSGSQGAIYPLLRKLESCQFVESKASTADQRKTKLVAITTKGIEQLKSWYDVTRPPSIQLKEYDAIRTQLFFINVLPISKQKSYFESMMQLLRKQHAELIAEIEKCESDQIMHQVVWKGVLAFNEARQAWLSETRRLLSR